MLSNLVDVPGGTGGDVADRRRWIGLGVALIIVDSTIVNVATPSIINDLGITSTQAQWVQEIYTLVFAALLLVWGRLADQFVVGCCSCWAPRCSSPPTSSPPWPRPATC